MKKIAMKILWNLKGGYRPKEFWDNWAETFMDDQWQREIHKQHSWILSKIRAMNPKTILEIGCGFGRNIKFLIENGIEPNKITGIDISSKMIKNARIYIQSNKVKLQVADVLSLPFKNREFDLVLVHGVFMHVKPQDIEAVIRETLRITKKTLINIEQNYNGNEYTFVHDYKKLYKENKSKIKEYVHNKVDGLDYLLIEKE